MIRIKELFDLSHSRAGEYLSHYEYPHEALGGIRALIEQLFHTLKGEAYTEIKKNVWVADSARVAPTAYLGEYTIVGENTEIRHGAFIRGSALVGDGCVIGNSTELKNAILFDGVQVPHYNYVGDSILGYRAHMGAGSIASNVRSDKGSVRIHSESGTVDSGLSKLGAMLGDFAEIGCNTVLCPGAVVGRGGIVYPLTRVRGTVPAGHILKGDGALVLRKDERGETK